MQLTILGMWAVATAGETSSFLLRDDEFSLLIDAGMNPAFTLTRAGVRLVDVSHVLLSHCHADHLSGFASVVFSRQVQERRFGPAKPLQVIGTKETLAAGRGLLSLMYPDRSFSVDWREVTGSDSIVVGQSKWRFQETDHTVPGLSMRVERSSGSIFVYTSDTSLTANLSKFSMDADVLLCECFGTVEDFGPILAQQKHLSAEDAATLASKARAKNVVLFHMHEPYKNPAKRDALISIVKKGYSGRVIFPTEGEVVEV